jgi:hypothetical protein
LRLLRLKLTNLSIFECLSPPATALSPLEGDEKNQESLSRYGGDEHPVPLRRSTLASPWRLKPLAPNFPSLSLRSFVKHSTKSALNAMTGAEVFVTKSGLPRRPVRQSLNEGGLAAPKFLQRRRETYTYFHLLSLTNTSIFKIR